MSALAAQFVDWLHSVFVEQFSLWVVFGFVAQTLFFMRFLVQWLASERAGRSVVPASFWIFSIGGGTLLLIYAIYRTDPVFIAGQAAGLFVYLRNIVFLRRERRDRRNQS
ncbi:MAG: lipid-A-disaccharide synthase N-terminal domain-containing protein [Bauldia sp.]